jgi:hypothetical protein
MWRKSSTEWIAKAFLLDGVLVADTKGLQNLLDAMQSGAVLCFPLFDRENSWAKVNELDQFLLDFLQPFVPLAVSDLSLGSIAALTPRTPILMVHVYQNTD